MNTPTHLPQCQKRPRPEASLAPGVLEMFTCAFWLLMQTQETPRTNCKLPYGKLLRPRMPPFRKAISWKVLDQNTFGNFEVSDNKSPMRLPCVSCCDIIQLFVRLRHWAPLPPSPASSPAPERPWADFCRFWFWRCTTCEEATCLGHLKSKGGGSGTPGRKLHCTWKQCGNVHLWGWGWFEDFVNMSQQRTFKWAP